MWPKPGIDFVKGEKEQQGVMQLSSAAAAVLWLSQIDLLSHIAKKVDF